MELPRIETPPDTRSIQLPRSWQSRKANKLQQHKTHRTTKRQKSINFKYSKQSRKHRHPTRISRDDVLQFKHIADYWKIVDTSPAFSDPTPSTLEARARLITFLDEERERTIASRESDGFESCQISGVQHLPSGEIKVKPMFPLNAQQACPRSLNRNLSNGNNITLPSNPYLTTRMNRAVSSKKPNAATIRETQLNEINLRLLNREVEKRERAVTYQLSLRDRKMEHIGDAAEAALQLKRLALGFGYEFHHAAKTIQRFWHRRVQQRKLQLVKHMGAVTLQLFTRRVVARQTYNRLVQEHTRNKNAIVIQKYVRRMLSISIVMKRKREITSLEERATRLAAFFLGRIARNKFLRVRYIASKLQSKFRSQRQRKRYIKVVRRLINLQAIMRGTVTRRRVLSDQAAATRIQAWYRGCTCRYNIREWLQLARNGISVKAAMVLQSSWRYWKANQIYKYYKLFDNEAMRWMKYWQSNPQRITEQLNATHHTDAIPLTPMILVNHLYTFDKSLNSWIAYRLGFSLNVIIPAMHYGAAIHLYWRNVAKTVQHTSSSDEQLQAYEAMMERIEYHIKRARALEKQQRKRLLREFPTPGTIDFLGKDIVMAFIRRAMKHPDKCQSGRAHIMYAIALLVIEEDQEHAGQYFDKAMDIGKDDAQVVLHSEFFTKQESELAAKMSSHGDVPPVWQGQIKLASNHEGHLVIRRRALRFMYEFTLNSVERNQLDSSGNVLDVSPSQGARSETHQNNKLQPHSQSKVVVALFSPAEIRETAVKLDSLQYLETHLRDKFTRVVARMLSFDEDLSRLSIDFRQEPYPKLTHLTKNNEFLSVVGFPTPQRGLDLFITNSNTREVYRYTLSPSTITDLFLDQPFLIRATQEAKGWRRALKTILIRIVPLLSIQEFDNVPKKGDYVMFPNPAFRARHQQIVKKIAEQSSSRHMKRLVSSNINEEDEQNEDQQEEVLSDIMDQTLPLKFARVLDRYGDMVCIQPVSWLKTLRDRFVLVEDLHQQATAVTAMVKITQVRRIEDTKIKGGTVEGIDQGSKKIICKDKDGLAFLTFNRGAISSGGNSRHSKFRKENNLSFVVLHTAKRIEDAKRNVAAARIQSQYRRILATSIVAERRRQRAARIIQHTWRRRVILYRRVQEIAVTVIENRSASKMQRAWRFWWAKESTMRWLAEVFGDRSWRHAAKMMRLMADHKKDGMSLTKTTANQFSQSKLFSIALWLHVGETCVIKHDEESEAKASVARKLARENRSKLSKARHRKSRKRKRPKSSDAKIDRKTSAGKKTSENSTDQKEVAQQIEISTNVASSNVTEEGNTFKITSPSGTVTATVWSANGIDTNRNCDSSELSETSPRDVLASDGRPGTADSQQSSESSRPGSAQSSTGVSPRSYYEISKRRSSEMSTELSTPENNIDHLCQKFLSMETTTKTHCKNDIQVVRAGTMSLEVLLQTKILYRLLLSRNKNNSVVCYSMAMLLHTLSGGWVFLDHPDSHLASDDRTTALDCLASARLHDPSGRHFVAYAGTTFKRVASIRSRSPIAVFQWGLAQWLVLGELHEAGIACARARELCIGRVRATRKAKTTSFIADFSFENLLETIDATLVQIQLDVLGRIRASRKIQGAYRGYWFRVHHDFTLRLLHPTSLDGAAAHATMMLNEMELSLLEGKGSAAVASQCNMLLDAFDAIYEWMLIALLWYGEQVVAFHAGQDAYGVLRRVQQVGRIERGSLLLSNEQLTVMRKLYIARFRCRMGWLATTFATIIPGMDCSSRRQALNKARGTKSLRLPDWLVGELGTESQTTSTRQHILAQFNWIRPNRPSMAAPKFWTAEDDRDNDREWRNDQSTALFDAGRQFQSNVIHEEESADGVQSQVPNVSSTTTPLMTCMTRVLESFVCIMNAFTLPEWRCTELGYVLHKARFQHVFPSQIRERYKARYKEQDGLVLRELANCKLDLLQNSSTLGENTVVEATHLATDETIQSETPTTSSLLDDYIYHVGECNISNWLLQISLDKYRYGDQKSSFTVKVCELLATILLLFAIHNTGIHDSKSGSQAIKDRELVLAAIECAHLLSPQHVPTAQVAEAFFNDGLIKRQQVKQQPKQEDNNVKVVKRSTKTTASRKSRTMERMPSLKKLDSTRSITGEIHEEPGTKSTSTGDDEVTAKVSPPEPAQTVSKRLNSQSKNKHARSFRLNLTRGKSTTSEAASESESQKGWWSSAKSLVSSGSHVSDAGVLGEPIENKSAANVPTGDVEEDDTESLLPEWKPKENEEVIRGHLGNGSSTRSIRGNLVTSTGNRVSSFHFAGMSKGVKGVKGVSFGKKD